MQIKPLTWKIKTLITKENKINPKPQYQRTPVWTFTKKELLIDSILRGYDLPKLYMRATPNDPMYEFEVVDGQQRMRAIWEFYKDKYGLDESEIEGSKLKGLNYSKLPSNLKDKFEDFTLAISLIENTTPEEIRTLFARLQMGVTLNPAELRHAMVSNIGFAIQSIITNHKFFNKDCKIQDKRYKHQDYLDHVMTLICCNGTRNIKALDMKQMYLDLASSKQKGLANYMRKVNRILDWIYDINQFEKGLFKNKWAFVDTFWLLYKNHDNIEGVKPKNFANSFLQFEAKRKKYIKNPEKLIEDKTSKDYDKEMYEYIQAFKNQGGIIENIQIRNRVFKNYFNNSRNFKFRK